MAKIYATVLLVLLVALVKKEMVREVDGCYLDVSPGGCPSPDACIETCRPCYRGVGKVIASCVAPGAGIDIWRCRCTFKDGAPCSPVGQPICPKPPAPTKRTSY